MEPTTWHLVRHGETEWNRTLRIQGATDVPLSDIGRAQAEALAERLSDVSFDAVYASDLSRASETARIAVGTRQEIQLCRELRELSYGRWEGLTSEEAEALDPDDYRGRFAGRREDFAAPGGETSRELVERIQRFRDDVRARHSPGETILIVAHGGSIRALAVCLLDLPLTRLWSFEIGNTGCSIIKTWPGIAVLERWNDTSHLARLETST